MDHRQRRYQPTHGTTIMGTRNHMHSLIVPRPPLVIITDALGSISSCGAKGTAMTFYGTAPKSSSERPFPRLGTNTRSSRCCATCSIFCKKGYVIRLYM